MEFVGHYTHILGERGSRLKNAAFALPGIEVCGYITCCALSIINRLALKVEA